MSLLACPGFREDAGGLELTSPDAGAHVEDAGTGRDAAGADADADADAVDAADAALPISATPKTSSLAPTLVSFGDTLVMLYVPSASSSLVVSSSVDGVHWTVDGPVADLHTNAPVGAAVHEGAVHVSAIDENGVIVHAQSPDARTWSAASPTPFKSTLAASLASLDGRLYLAYAGDDPVRLVTTAASTSGATWGASSTIGANATGTPPALVAFNAAIYAIYTGNNDTNLLVYTSTADGSAWARERRLDGHATQVRPACAVLGDTLHVIYPENTGTQLLAVSTKDATSWAAEVPITGLHSKLGVGLAAFKGRLHMAYVSMTTSTLVHTSSADGVNWKAPTE